MNILELDIDSDVQYFVNTLRSMNLYCITSLSNRNRTCLDNIYTNIDKFICTFILLKQDIISYYAGILVNILFSKGKFNDKYSEVKTKRLFSPVRLSNFKESRLYSIDWSFLNNTLDVTVTCEFFLTKLTSYLNIHFPLIMFQQN